MLFNIYENKFEDEVINDKINKNLSLYDYSYNLLNIKKISRC